MDGTTVAIVLFEGVEELDAVGPYEALSIAGRFGDELDVSLRTLEPTERVTCAHGMRVEPDGTLPGDADLIVVPGGGWSSGGGVRDEVDRGELPAAIADWYDDGIALASVCTGGMLLAEAGVLDGRSAVTHAGAMNDLREYEAIDVVDARVVDDGDVLTAGGVTSGIDLALHLVERLRGADVAEEIATVLEHDRDTDVYQA